jgi:ribosome-binding protein aMBF1 (putative translation factor)
MDFKDLYKKILADNPEMEKIIEDKDNEFYSDVSNLIAEARIHAGLTQEKLAKKLKTKQSSIARIERGTSLPSLSFLFKIAKALDTYLIAPKFGFMENQNKHPSPCPTHSPTKN